MCSFHTSLVTLCFLALGALSGVPANAQSSQEGLVESRILDFDPQTGVKSQHFYFVNFSDETVTSSFSTGTSKINLGVIEFEVSSIRDNFKVSSVLFTDDVVTFTLEGTTASGVAVMPDIDYRFDFTVAKSGQVSVSGCHDGYPAYLIQHQGKNLYRFEHASMGLIKLFGTCDQEVRVD
ncbi:DUF3238 domain-containing protein [Primorskyibacter sp. 2E233]|uniref:DUF3238 domain-containing protein n=1 Tax=Primorskyibacter sp. 2E233 TaxID=3413431 RepID=UPI003BF376EB